MPAVSTVVDRDEQAVSTWYRQCLQTISHNFFDPWVNGRGPRVNGVCAGGCRPLDVACSLAVDCFVCVDPRIDVSKLQYVKLLGKGGNCEAWLCTYEGVGEVVAKIPDPSTDKTEVEKMMQVCPTPFPSSTLTFSDRMAGQRGASCQQTRREHQADTKLVLKEKPPRGGGGAC